MKTTLSLLTALTLPSLAATFSYTVTNLDYGTATSSLHSSYVTTGSTGSYRTYQYNITGDLDGQGLDDNLRFTFRERLYSGSTWDGTDVTLGTATDISSSTDIYLGQDGMSAGDSIHLVVNNIQFTSGELGATYTGDLTSIGGITALRSTADTQLAIGTTGADVWTGSDTTGFVEYSGDSPFIVTVLDRGTVDGLGVTDADDDLRLRWADITFELETIDTIPEPSSAALLGLGGLALLLRRKK